jgi:hypothetical protein
LWYASLLLESPIRKTGRHGAVIVIRPSMGLTRYLSKTCQKMKKSSNASSNNSNGVVDLTIRTSKISF